MWMREVLVGIVGFSGGVTVATALAAFIIGLGIIPRYAGITHTGHHLLLYENCLILGTIGGSIFYLYQLSLPFGSVGLGIFGLFFGIFLGSWIIALGEVVNVFAIMARRIGLTKGFGLIIISVALGKVLGSLILFFSML